MGKARADVLGLGYKPRESRHNITSKVGTPYCRTVECTYLCAAAADLQLGCTAQHCRRYGDGGGDGKRDIWTSQAGTYIHVYSIQYDI